MTTKPLSWKDGLAAYIERRKLVSELNISALHLAQIAERLRAVDRDDLIVLPVDPLTILRKSPPRTQIIVTAQSADECSIAIHSGDDTNSRSIPYLDAFDAILEAASP